ncbi:MAG: 23S rRNA (guanosine(2251)-2'-O)-methyltransferase RlmB [Pseudomonadota bacterium]
MSRGQGNSGARRPGRAGSRRANRAEVPGSARVARADGDWVAGKHAAMAALAERGTDVLEVFIQRGDAERRLQEAMELAAALGVSAQLVPGPTLEAMAAGTRHQGIVLRMRSRPPPDFRTLLDELTRAPRDVLVLDGVDDPHNLGAALRCAAAVDAAGLVLPRSRAAPLTEVARKVASGGAELVPVYPVPNLARALRALRELGLPLLGLDGGSPTSIYQLDLSTPHVLIAGTEGDGMRQLTRSLCDVVASIPMPGRMESLNMSVAIGIALFEMLRQREARSSLA